LRVALVARAFMRPRRLYLLDEPFDGLDTAAREQLRQRLDSAVAAGATLVMAAHHLEDVPPYVQNVLRLRRGRAPIAAVREPQGSVSRRRIEPRRSAAATRPSKR
jgi:ABC-type molybdenum transport system ATPase subunit/photorepair protein PhrA